MLNYHQSSESNKKKNSALHSVGKKVTLLMPIPQGLAVLS